MSVNIVIDDKMSKFMIRNILGHEPCHDFNPTNQGSRYSNLSNQLENLKLNKSNQTGGGDEDEEDVKDEEKGDRKGEGEKEDEKGEIISDYMNMENDTPSNIYNQLAMNSSKNNNLNGGGAESSTESSTESIQSLFLILRIRIRQLGQL